MAPRTSKKRIVEEENVEVNAAVVKVIASNDDVSFDDLFEDISQDNETAKKIAAQADLERKKAERTAATNAKNKALTRYRDYYAETDEGKQMYHVVYNAGLPIHLISMKRVMTASGWSKLDVNPNENDPGSQAYWLSRADRDPKDVLNDSMSRMTLSSSPTTSTASDDDDTTSEATESPLMPAAPVKLTPAQKKAADRAAKAAQKAAKAAEKAAQKAAKAAEKAAAENADDVTESEDTLMDN